MTGKSVIVGEVHTGLLHHSSAISPGAAAQLVDAAFRERVTRSDRPMPQVWSPPTLTGVDCLLPATTGARVHGVGTILSRAGVTGGHLVQGLAYTAVRQGVSDRRQPWSHYLARPGQVETLTRLNLAAVGAGFLAPSRTPDQLDLEAISRRTLDDVQDNPALDHRSALRVPRLKLRFVIDPSATDPGGADPRGADPRGADPDVTPVIEFGVAADMTRTVRLGGGDGTAPLAAQVELMTDLARHDWLLTTLLTLIERSRIGSDARRQVLARLTPAIEHLVHLWMPGARTHTALTGTWRALEVSPAFSRQWQVSVDRVRDQVSLGLLEARLASSEERVDTW